MAPKYILLKTNEQVADEMAGILLDMKPGDMVLVTRYDPDDHDNKKIFSVRSAEAGIVR